MARRRPEPDGLPLSEVLRYLAKGKTLRKTADYFDRTQAEVARALETLARSLEKTAEGDRSPGSSIPRTARSSVKKRGSIPRRVKVFTDGASRGNPGEAGVGWVIESGKKILLDGGNYIGTTTNNVAEYRAVLQALEKVLELGIREADFYLDSELVVKQVNGEYRVKDPKLVDLHGQLKVLCGEFASCSFSHISRRENSRADKLANKAIDDREEAESKLGT